MGHIRRTEDSRILKDILYGELENGKRNIDCPHLRYRDVCKTDMKALEINSDHWEYLVVDRSGWRSTLTKQLISGEEKLINAVEDKRTHRKNAAA